MIAALYVQKGGVYYGLPDVDPWDEERDARYYEGPWPVVAHPPCERWSLLNHLHKDKPGKAFGDDGGCFREALGAVIRFGGVLEHPAESAAFAAFGLPRPTRGWQRVLEGGWVTEVNQAAYGHEADKRTWLYYDRFSDDMPPPQPLNWQRIRGVRSIGVARGRTDVAKSRRSKTPTAFRDLLLDLARSSSFKGPCPPGMEGSHEDGDRTNNRVENLSWKTRSENHLDKRRHGTDQAGERAWNALYTNDEAQEIRIMFLGGATVDEIQARFGGGPDAINRLLSGRTYIERTGRRIGK